MTFTKDFCRIILKNNITKGKQANCACFPFSMDEKSKFTLENTYL